LLKNDFNTLTASFKIDVGALPDVGDWVICKIHELISDFKTEDMNIIRLALMKMYDYNLPSTIKNIKNWKKYIEDDSNNKTKNIINVLIAGAGPLGLYTALYLNNYYNRPENNKKLINCYVNILVIDNRIYKEGIKKPYTRSTQFGFDIEQIQPFIKQIFCWKNFDNNYKGTRRFDFINILENLLYVAAYNENISMYFTKKLEDFNDIKTFMKDQNIHYIFDCTGGRLKNTKNLKHNMVWDKFKFNKGKNEVKFNDETKYFEYYENNKLFTKTFVILELFDKKMKFIKVGNHFSYVTNDDDFLLIDKFKNLCLKKEDFLVLCRYFKSDSIRTNYAQTLDEFIKWPDEIRSDYITDENIKYIKLTTFNSIARHAPYAATKINKNSTYIKLGDSLGATEFGIKYGMWTSILFSKHICNLLSSVKYF